jgi:hypothetical protein
VPESARKPQETTVNDLNIKSGTQTVLLRAYLASLLERTARAGAALTGGLVYETGEVLLPLAVRRSRLYQAIVGRLLRIMIELVGGVEGVYPSEEMQARELLVRKTAGNVVELSRTIVEEGLLSFLRRTSTPCLTRAGSHFDPPSSTYSERLLRRLADRRSPVGGKTTPQTEASDEENPSRG